MKRSSKLSLIEYFKLEVKCRLSFITHWLLFSSKREYLKNPSLAAKNGLKLKLVDVLKLEVSFLWYINLESEYARRRRGCARRQR